MVFSAQKSGKQDRAGARKYGEEVQWAGKAQEKRQVAHKKECHTKGRMNK